MADDTNPPVGATVEGYPRKGIQVLRHDEKGEARWGFLLADEDGETPIESCFTDHAAITLAWRMQQRAEQAEARLQELREALAIYKAEMEDLQFELRAQLAAARADVERLVDDETLARAVASVHSPDFAWSGRSAEQRALFARMGRAAIDAAKGNDHA